jgi:hypothetical protein
VAHAHRADHVDHQQSRGRVGAHVLETSRVGLVDPAGCIHKHVDPSVQRVGLYDKPVNRSLVGDINLGSAG